VHRQGQGQRALRVRRQGLHRHHQRPRPRRSVRAARPPRRCPATHTNDGHTLKAVIEDTQKLTGCEIERGYVDKGYRGHDTENPRRIFISGQKRGVFGVINGRCYLKGRAGDAANAILSAVGHNFRRILAWLRDLLCLFLIEILRLLISRSALNPAC
jgi:hypothetical protein